jgi:flagellar hook protein FlgE
MGISSALYSGVSGMNTNGQAMSVIGNNLANTNTVGFKGSRTVFSDLLSSQLTVLAESPRWDVELECQLLIIFSARALLNQLNPI